MKSVVVGTGYVGLANAVVLSQNHRVVAVDTDPTKVALIERGISPIGDSELQSYLSNVPLNLEATMDAASADKEAEFVIIATPTDYDPHYNFFDTSSVEGVI